MENINKDVTTNEPTATPSSGETEKLFTQTEVNEIVEKRLSRYKTKMNETIKQSDSEAEARAADLAARESKVACWEYVIERGYPVDLLDIIGTDNVDGFKEKADKLAELKKTIAPDYPNVSDYGENPKVKENNDLAKAFSRGNAHIPKKAPKKW